MPKLCLLYLCLIDLLIDLFVALFSGSFFLGEAKFIADVMKGHGVIDGTHV
jgi:hypothetical protein